MRVLFVSSYNSNSGISPIVKNQAESLKKTCKIDFFGIVGKGIFGYLSNISLLRKKISENKYDLVHAHYSFSGVIAALAGARPLVVSLMGSDIKAGVLGRLTIFFFNLIFWGSTIVKSKDSKNALNIKGLHVIPNGVDFSRFYPRDKIQSKIELGWDINKKQILFASDPNRAEKNFSLADKAFNLLDKDVFEMQFLRNVSNEQVPVLLNAADVIILSSLWEGSPNVIKEALACNRPVVSTDCGDVNETLPHIEGSFISSYDPIDFSNCIIQASNYESTHSREFINYLDSKVISEKILSIYKNLII